MDDFNDLLSSAEELQQQVMSIRIEPHQNDPPCPNRNLFQSISAAQHLSENGHRHDMQSEQGKYMLLNSGINIDDVDKRIAQCQIANKFELRTDAETSDVAYHLESTLEHRILGEFLYEGSGTFAQCRQSARKQLDKDVDDHKSQLLNQFLKEDNMGDILYPEGTTQGKKYSGANNACKGYSDLTRSLACGSTYEKIFYEALLPCTETKRRTNADPNYVKCYIRSVYQGPTNIQVRDLWAMAACIDEFAPPRDKRPVGFSDRNSIAWVRPSIKYLENIYSAYMFKITHNNELCSIPSVVYDTIMQHTMNMTRPEPSVTEFPNLIRIDDNIPISAFLYYTFRSGFMSLIQDKIETNLLQCCNEGSIIKLFRALRDYDKNGFTIDPTITVENEPRTQLTARNACQDPFYAILWSIVRKNNIDYRGVRNIVTTCEDFLWLKLHHVVFVKTDGLTVKELLKQKAKLDTPTLHFDMFQYLIFEGAGNEHQDPLTGNPLVRFMCLLLTCQYETALLYLYRHVSYRIHAVYMAIALFKQDLIQSSMFVQLRLPFAQKDDNCPIDISAYLNTPINVASLVEDYVWDSEFFQVSGHAPNVVYDYERCLTLFHSIQEIRAANDESILDTKVAEFLLKYKCYDELFGKYQINICELKHRLRVLRHEFPSTSYPLMCEDWWDEMTCTCGSPHPTTSNKFGLDDMDDLESYLSDFRLCPVVFRDGIVFRLVGRDEKRFKEMVKVAAVTALNCGMEADAIQLNTICGDLVVALKLINRKLAYYYDKNPELEDRKSCLKMASTLTDLLPYYKLSDSCQSVIKSFRILTLACNAHESYADGLYNKTMRAIERMDVVPADASYVDVKLKEFARYDPCVKITIGSMVRLLVDLYDHTLSTLLEATSLGILDQSKAMQFHLKQRTSALVLFISKDKNWFFHDETSKKLLEINDKLESLSS